MDNQIKFVCREFGISEDQLFDKRRFRKIADARAVLYNIMDQPNANQKAIVLEEKRGFVISRSAIMKAIDNGLTFYSELINKYKLNSRHE